MKMCTVYEVRNCDLMRMMRRFNKDFTPIQPDGVRRVLFGERIDHEATARDLNQQMREMETEARSRWNFDFGTEDPLPGRYQWSSVINVRSWDPADHSNPGSGRRSDSSATQVEASKSNQTVENEPVLAKETSEVGSVLRKATVQTKMTDFATQRKRPSSLPLKSSITQSDSCPISSKKLRRTASTDGETSVKPPSSLSRPSSPAKFVTSPPT